MMGNQVNVSFVDLEKSFALDCVLNASVTVNVHACVTCAIQTRTEFQFLSLSAIRFIKVIVHLMCAVFVYSHSNLSNVAPNFFGVE